MAMRRTLIIVVLLAGCANHHPQVIATQPAPQLPTPTPENPVTAALWLTAATLLIRPNSDGRAKAAPAARGGRRQPAGATAVAGSAARGTVPRR